MDEKSSEIDFPTSIVSSSYMFPIEYNDGGRYEYD